MSMNRRFIHPRTAHAGPRTQRGAALLTAMVIVTLVTTLAASMVWQQWRSVQVEAAERSLVQSQWMLSGALDYGRMILRADDAKIDHLGEPWALGLAETRVSSLLSADKENTDDAPDAFLSGQLVDATSRYNLYNLLSNAAPREVLPQQLEVLKKLCQFASLSPALADGLAQAMRKAVLVLDARADPSFIADLGGDEGRASAPLLPQTLDQLVWLGIDAGTIERLRPFVTVLPPTLGSTPINVNTAPREVIAAVVPDLDLGRADRLVQMRQRNPFKDMAEVQAQLGASITLPAVEAMTMTSAFFEVRGRLRLEDRVLSQNYLVTRNGREVTVLLEERVAGVQMMPTRPQ
jgi:general secretion pathway protein K